MSAVDQLINALSDLPDSPKPDKVVRQVTGVFERLGTATNAEGQAHFMPGLDHAYGVRVPDVRALAKRVARIYKANPSLCRSIAQKSWPHGSREHRLFALEVIAATGLPAADCWALGVSFLSGVRTWEDCDQLCSATLGEALAVDPAYMDTLETWLEDENIWVRRAALVSTVYLRRSTLSQKVLHDLDRRVLAMCAVLIDDRAPYIRKAVDWAVREVLGRHYDLASGWLMAQARRGPSRTAQTTLKKSAKKLTKDDQRIFLAMLRDAQ